MFDDVWEDVENQVYENKMRERENKNITSKMESVGFKEGMEINVDEIRQRSFEEGFKKGSNDAIFVAKILGTIGYLFHLKKCNENIAS